MSDKSDSEPKVNRRSLLKLVSASAVSAIPLGKAHADDAANAAHNHAAAPSPTAAAGAEAPPSYGFFNLDEAAFIEAVVDTLIPSDEVGPGALELGVATFIDRQMSSGYGRGDRMYLQGPFAEGTPEQGYQLRMTPSELMQAGIGDVNAYAQKSHQATFDALSPEQRAAVLTELETGKVELPTVPTRMFFGLLYDLTMQGYFSDPVHGGNKGKASWKMVGFPGVGVMYADKIEAWRNKRFMSEPLSIQDLL